MEEIMWPFFNFEMSDDYGISELAESTNTTKEAPYSFLNDDVFLNLAHLWWIQVPPIIVTNVLVMAATYYIKRLHTPDNVLIAGLAFTDLLSGVVGMPFLYFRLQTQTAKLIQNTEFICKFGLLMASVFTKTSLSILFLMSLDRFFAIKYPFCYHQYATNSIAVAGICFVLFIQMAMYGFVYWALMPFDMNLGYQERCSFGQIPAWFGQFVVYLVLWIQILVSLFLTIQVAFIAWRQLNQTAKITNHFYNKSDLAKELAHVKITLSLMFLYVLLWMPTCIMMIMFSLNASEQTLTRTYMIGKHFEFLNAWINAIVYAMSKTTYKKAYHFLMTTSPMKWHKVNILLRQDTICKSTTKPMPKSEVEQSRAGPSVVHQVVHHDHVTSTNINKEAPRATTRKKL